MHAYHHINGFATTGKMKCSQHNDWPIGHRINPHFIKAAQMAEYY